SARGESRTRTGLPPGDFESPASAIPPLGLDAAHNLAFPEASRHPAPDGSNSVESCSRQSSCQTPSRKRLTATRGQLGNTGGWQLKTACGLASGNCSEA